MCIAMNHWSTTSSTGAESAATHNPFLLPAPATHPSTSTQGSSHNKWQRAGTRCVCLARPEPQVWTPALCRTPPFQSPLKCLKHLPPLPPGPRAHNQRQARLEGPAHLMPLSCCTCTCRMQQPHSPAQQHLCPPYSPTPQQACFGSTLRGPLVS